MNLNLAEVFYIERCSLGLTWDINRPREGLIVLYIFETWFLKPYKFITLYLKKNTATLMMKDTLASVYLSAVEAKTYLKDTIVELIAKLRLVR